MSVVLLVPRCVSLNQPSPLPKLSIFEPTWVSLRSRPNFVCVFLSQNVSVFVLDCAICVFVSQTVSPLYPCPKLPVFEPSSVCLSLSLQLCLSFSQSLTVLIFLAHRGLELAPVNHCQTFARDLTKNSCKAIVSFHTRHNYKIRADWGYFCLTATTGSYNDIELEVPR